MPIYLDCNATTPVEPAVAEAVRRYLEVEFGNAGSRTHAYGARAKKAVAEARNSVAELVDADASEVVFTSGATESNNLALLGLFPALKESGQTHVLTTQIEHKAVLEPAERLQALGFEVEFLPPTEGGFIDPTVISDRIREETGLVTVMHVNNETGVIQPIGEVAAVLEDHDAWFHVDAAQGFGKVAGLKNSRVDLISVSGHKVFAPKGIGALIARRRGPSRSPLSPLMVGGGQERGLRPGTLPVHLIAGLGEAARLARQDAARRQERCEEIGRQLMSALSDFPIRIYGDSERRIVSTVNLGIEGVDAEAAMVCLKDVVAISNGAACTSKSYTTSHVLEAMGVAEEERYESLRWSWCHLTEDLPVEDIRRSLRPLV